MKKKQIFNHSYNLQQPSATHSVEQLLNTAVQYHQRGQLQLAEQQYKKILDLQPKHDYALNLMGVLTSQYRGDHKQAEKLLRKAIKVDPQVPDYHGNLGLCLQQQKKYTEAEKAYKKATSLNPEFTNAWFGLGNVNMYLKNPELAIKYHQKAIGIDPKFLPAYNNLGNIYRELGQFDDAITMFKRMLELKPDIAEAWYNLGLVYRIKSDADNAINALEKAIELKNDYARAYCNKGVCYYKLLDDIDRAFQDFDKAIEIEPDYVFSYLQKASIYQDTGQFDKAENILRKAIEIDELSVGAYLGLANTNTKFINKQDTFQLQKILEEEGLGVRKTVLIQFALGKIFHDSKQYDKAFQYYEKGNELFRANYQYDVEDFKKEVSEILQIFNESFIKENSTYGSESELPVFIVGMPRSGTTLTEQIIASHPEVCGGGELPYLQQVISELPERHKDLDVFNVCMSQLTPSEINLLAEGYLSKIKKLDDKALRITDKLPHNFLRLGLITVLYPNARIIHCKRDLMDTCLSIYFHHFEGPHPYAYELKELGTYYKQYSSIMDYWESLFPKQVYTVQYEELIRDPETTSKDLIEHIGLEWDERCLKYYENERSVKTASQWQVRQPIYATSVKTWQYYSDHLQELKSALDT